MATVDDLLAVIARLQADVADLKRLGSSRWGATLELLTDLTTTSTRRYVSHGNTGILTTNGSSQIVVPYHGGPFPTACDSFVWSIVNGTTAVCFPVLISRGATSSTLIIDNTAGANVGAGFNVNLDYVAFGY
jgi:hypothetical protein